VLSLSAATVIRWLHVVAACVWIGGQVTIAVVIPLLRSHAPLATIVAKRYQMVAWPAFGVLVVTGIVNVGNAGLQWSHLLDSAAGRTLAVKLSLVALSGTAAGVHAFLQAPRRGERPSRRPWASVLLGSASLLAALAAALYGVAISSA
jgi:putative copper export protein